MRKSCTITFCSMFFSGLVYAQMYPPGWDFKKQDEQYLKIVEKKSTKLYELELNLRQIESQKQEILKSYKAGELSDEEAREKLIRLIKEEDSIRNSAEYRCEQLLLNAR
jgi:hypothetical protein